MPIASFRHGPIEVVDSRFRALLFAPEGATRDLNLALARDLVRFGGRVRVIGPALPAEFESIGITTPSCVDALAPLVEVIPLQAAAVRLAQLRGVPLGRFRFTPKVARDEAAFKRVE
jgi:glucosamine--fructose-6-phosphate aminotransferase (isomerizing)